MAVIIFLPHNYYLLKREKTDKENYSLQKEKAPMTGLMFVVFSTR